MGRKFPIFSIPTAPDGKNSSHAFFVFIHVEESFYVKMAFTLTNARSSKHVGGNLAFFFLPRIRYFKREYRIQAIEEIHVGVSQRKRMYFQV
jgi:hypothetical protein